MAFKNIEPVQVVKDPFQYEVDSLHHIALAKLKIGPNYLARFALETSVEDVYAEDYLVQIGKLVIPKTIESPEDLFKLEGTSMKERLADLFGFASAKNLKLVPLIQGEPARRKAESYDVTAEGMIITTTGQGMFADPHPGGYLLPESYLSK
jgi:hypothetical protein